MICLWFVVKKKKTFRNSTNDCGSVVCQHEVGQKPASGKYRKGRGIRASHFPERGLLAPVAVSPYFHARAALTYKYDAPFRACSTGMIASPSEVMTSRWLDCVCNIATCPTWSNVRSSSRNGTAEPDQSCVIASSVTKHDLPIAPMRDILLRNRTGEYSCREQALSNPNPTGPKRCMGRAEFPDLRGLRCEPWLDRPFFIESEMALLFRVRAVVCSKSA
jgi:hypothetical protein